MRFVKYFLVFIVIFTSGLYFLISSGIKKYDKIVRPMITEMAAKQWSIQVVSKYATPEFNKVINSAENQHGFHQFKSFGAMVKYGGTHKFSISVKNGNEKLQTQTYVQFKEIGDSNVTLELYKIDHQWKLNDINIRSIK